MKKIALATSILLFTTGCGVLVGNVKPVDEKASDYSITDLSVGNSDWKKLPSASEPDQTDVSDVSFQSEKTASIISINSACRHAASEHHGLREYTQPLLDGISDITLRTEKSLTVSKTPALQTTVRGKLSGEPMMLDIVVLKRGGCVYDLMYVARPSAFETQRPDFSRFVESLSLK